MIRARVAVALLVVVVTPVLGSCGADPQEAQRDEAFWSTVQNDPGLGASRRDEVVEFARGACLQMQADTTATWSDQERDASTRLGWSPPTAHLVARAAHQTLCPNVVAP